MSRIGRSSHRQCPPASTVTIDGQVVDGQGPEGRARRSPSPTPIEVKVEDGVQSLVTRPDDERESRSLHGLTRTLVNNKIIGVTEGYEKSLEVVGDGLPRRSPEGPQLGRVRPRVLAPDHRRPARRASPSRSRAPTSSGVAASTSRLVGEVAANIRKLRKPGALQGQGRRATPARSSAARSERPVSDMAISLKNNKHTAGRVKSRLRRQVRGRKKVVGTAERPRLVVTRSPKHVSVQVVDDLVKGHTLASASTMEADLRSASGDKTAKAEERRRARRRARQGGRCRRRSSSTAAGNKYHGRVAALADGARAGGLDLLIDKTPSKEREEHSHERSPARTARWRAPRGGRERSSRRPGC